MVEKTLVDGKPAYYMTDRSGIVDRENCPRLRFLGRHAGPKRKGIERKEASIPLLSGQAIHTAHSLLFQGKDIDFVLARTLAEYRVEVENRGFASNPDTPRVMKEQASLFEGTIRMWAKTRLPMILEEYELVSTEEQWFWNYWPGLVEPIRMDVIVRRKDDQLLHIIDFKGANHPDDSWMRKHELSRQTVLYLLALKERYQEPVGGIMYEGIVRGSWRKDTAKGSPWYGMKIQNSPYIYGYKLDGEIPQYQTAYTNRKGYKKVRSYDEMSMENWIDTVMLNNGDQSIKPEDLFIVMPPISPSPWELESLRKQIAIAELKWHAELEDYYKVVDAYGEDSKEARDYLDLFAPQHTEQCSKYGEEYLCQMHRDMGGPCFNEGAMPLEDGAFRERESHHAIPEGM